MNTSKRTTRLLSVRNYRYLRLSQISAVIGLALFSGRIAFAQSDLDASDLAPVESSAPSVDILLEEDEPAASSPPLDFAAPAEPSSTFSSEPAAPAAESPIPDSLPIEPPTPDVIEPNSIVPTSIPSIPEDFNSVFVDPTDYSIGATSPEATSEVPEIVVTERSSGCQFSINDARAFPDTACAQTNIGQVGTQSSPIAQSDPSFRPAQQVSQQASSTAPAGQSVNIGPVSFSASGIRIANGNAIENRAYFNRAVRPIVNSQIGQKFIFPLSVPSPITSLFGWRQHPIFGDQRFHAGTDIGAPEGTPVLAAQAGRVVTSGDMGGYGLTVALRHGENEDLESLYPHLSEILVEAGEQVKKGDVIGLVGSTGNSTGPHLHFEMRQLTADGWVIVDSDAIVRQSLAAMVQALNNPLQTLGQNIETPRFTSTAEVTSRIAQNLPFRPAQPNAH